jgi:hypothetical protein
MAPSERPVYDAHQSKIFESGIPGPNIWTLKIQPLGQFLPHLGFLLGCVLINTQIAARFLLGQPHIGLSKKLHSRGN